MFCSSSDLLSSHTHHQISVIFISLDGIILSLDGILNLLRLIYTNLINKYIINFNLNIFDKNDLNLIKLINKLDPDGDMALSKILESFDVILHTMFKVFTGEG